MFLSYHDPIWDLPMTLAQNSLQSHRLYLYSVVCSRQATIAEMVRDEEEDAIRSAVTSGKEPLRPDTLYASFTSEEEEDGPSRSRSKRRRKAEPARQRPSASGRSSRPGSTTASPIKVGLPFSSTPGFAGHAGESVYKAISEASA